ncbi:MAG: multi-copper polyphenol oxidoreductase [Arenimonas sp. SCN 70-307]|uniref:peptidoglycan editing factor PgeF n=1 Tax=Arenimonas sp. SCN 70-307 TaxID=1660089 RepID=UPI000868D404|nr:peptidoglycan editing factor PgeF [Arenimonas sp. SCN 70-307]ODS63077.1 MAG: multi-copper polyphenol oxidoreductase [Arenimonas sp. SCN 70-307]
MAGAAWLDADWPAPPGVRAVTSLRSGDGVSQAPFDRLNLGMNCGDEPAAVLENRRRMAAWLQLPSQPRWLRQVHGVEVVRVGAGLARGEGAPEPEPEADAAVTSEPGVVLAILTADCLPVVFAARDGSEIGAAHAGWRGLAGGVLEATVAAMHTPPGELVAWLGPAAGPVNYEIGEEVRAAFTGPDPGAAEAFIATRPGHWRVDLYALARRRLAAVGVTNVHGGGLCTIADPSRFYSHRRDGRSGRLATLAWLGAS